MSNTNLIIYAPNLSVGGGRTLIFSIFNAIKDEFNCSLLYLDLRLKKQLTKKTNPRLHVQYVEPTFFSRLFSEFDLYKKTTKFDRVLMLGSLGPLTRLKGDVYLFVHNRYLIADFKTNKLAFKTRFRIFVEKLWLRFSLKNVDVFIVQTESMALLLKRSGLTNGKVVKILPFIDNFHSKPPKPRLNHQKFDFIYVASGEHHKNHKNLITAWGLLALKGIKPSLGLTLDSRKFSDIVCEIKNSNLKFGTRIENLGNLSHKEALALYSNSFAMVYPSSFESFGIPLLEATSFNLPIVASELDYVRDVVVPCETFNPESAISISRAIQRFLKKETTVASLLTASEFLRIVSEV